MIQEAAKYLKEKGKRIIGWTEILEGGLVPDATLMSWIGESGGIEAAHQHHDVIMTPNTYLYFDYYQSKKVEDELWLSVDICPLKRLIIMNRCLRN